MTIQTLQDIIRIENKLHADEQAARKKAAQWLQEKEAEIRAEYGAKRDALAARREEIKKQAGKKAEAKAADIVGRGKREAARLAGLDDALLRACLGKHLGSILAGDIQ